MWDSLAGCAPRSNGATGGLPTRHRVQSCPTNAGKEALDREFHRVFEGNPVPARRCGRRPGSPDCPPSRFGGTGYQAPSDTLTIAAVGIGGMGRNYLEGCKAEKIVALCDLDHNYAAKVFDTYPAARRYHDYREMFDKEEKNFDALIIAVPDHMHSILLMSGIRMKKHIYCAKPIAHSIGEVRKVREALLATKGIVTKGSIQDSRTDYSRSTTEILNTGVLGPIREIHIWSFHPIYPTGLVRPTETMTPPAGMDWDMWIGPSPFRPYHKIYHPANWRAWWDFGTADVGDMGCHTFHTYFEELQLEHAQGHLRVPLDALRGHQHGTPHARNRRQRQSGGVGVSGAGHYASAEHVLLRWRPEAAASGRARSFHRHAARGRVCSTATTAS